MKSKLIYICGMGHNGSTILNLALNLSGNVTATSQLNELLNPYDPGTVTEDQITETEHFWRDILDELSESDKALLRKSNRANRAERNVVKLFFSKGSRRELAKSNEKVVQAISAKTGTNVVVDSSKNVSRGIGLTECQDIDVYFIHLIRDVRGLVNSANKRALEQSKPKKYVRPAVHWFLKNLLASWLLKTRASNLLNVHYEEIVLKPDHFVDRLEEFVGEKFPETRLALRGEIDIDQTTVGFSGNRVLKKKKNRFRTGKLPDDGVFQSSRFWFSLGWLSSFWGYRRKSSPTQLENAHS